MIGQIYKVHSDKYLVKSQGRTYDLRARGVLKLKKENLSVGDFVEFNKDTIESVKARKNHFIRPNVSNVDLIVAVISPEPKPDYYLLDKLLISAIKEDVELIIVVNKTDIDTKLVEELEREYSKLNVNIISVCAKYGENIQTLKQKLSGKLSVLAGQSAVGKTSLINSLFGLELKTGDLSEKTLRGKHTTTRSEIFEFMDMKLIDTPGFAVIDAGVPADELKDYYPEYLELANECKFRGCKHIHEPDCKVKQAIDSGILSKTRYQRYKEIYTELQERRENYEKD